MNQIIQPLKDSSTVLLASHTNPDGDAIGSLVVMGLALEKLGKTVTMFNDSPMPAVYRFLPGIQRIRNRVEDVESYDTAVILDCGDIVRIGSLADRVKSIPMVINIDHHITNTGFGNVQLIDTAACATAELVYRLIQSLAVPIDIDMATLLYTAIFTDTGSFRFSSTNREAFTICNQMVSMGVDPYQVAQNVYGTYSLGRIKLLNLALDSIEIAAEGKVSIMTVSREMLAKTATQPEDADGLINYAKRIEDVRLAALIHEDNGTGGSGNGAPRYHVSLRSDGTIDVAAIAAEFGGGGHANAAGFNAARPLAEIKAEIIRIAERF